MLRQIPPDPRAARSLLALTGAVTELLDDGVIAGLSITDVVRQAGVSRPTFYQHFPDIEAAAQHAALVRLEEALPFRAAREPLPPLDNGGRLRAIVESAHPIFEHLSEKRHFYMEVVVGAGSLEFFDELVSFIGTRVLPPRPMHPGDAIPERDHTAFLASGILWFVLRWLKSSVPGESNALEAAHRLAETILNLSDETPQTCEKF